MFAMFILTILVSILLSMASLGLAFKENVTAEMSSTGAQSSERNVVCWDNMLDVMVELDNGHLYGVKHRWAWRLQLHSNRSGKQLWLTEDQSVEQPSSPLSRLWPNLPEDVELSFTMPHLSSPQMERMNESHSTAGSTIFVKQPHYFLYHNYRFVHQKSVVHWEPNSFADNRFVATLHRTNLVLIAKVGNIPDGIKGLAGGLVFVFDCIQFPEKIGTFEVLSQHFRHMQWLNLRQLIPLGSSSEDHSDQYLAMFSLGTKGHYYCLMQNFNRSSLGACHLVPISSAFNCPAAILQLKQSNWAHTTWQLTGFSLERTILILAGGLMGSLWINLILLVNTAKQFNRYYSKDVLEQHAVHS